MSLNIIQPPKRNIQAVCDNNYAAKWPSAGRALQVGGSAWRLQPHLIKTQFPANPGSGEVVTPKRPEAP